MDRQVDLFEDQQFSPLPFGNDRQTLRISSRLVCVVRSSMGFP